MWIPDRDFMELYDIENDPFEQNEISNEHIELVSSIKEEIIDWNKDILSKGIFPK